MKKPSSFSVAIISIICLAFIAWLSIWLAIDLLNIIFELLIILLPAYLSSIYLKKVVKGIHILKSHKETTGVIIGRKEKETDSDEDGDMSIHYLPIVRFTDDDQNIIEVILKNLYKTKRKCKIGKKVKILYSPKNSHNAVIKGLMFKEILSSCLKGISLFIFALIMLIAIDILKDMG